MNTITVPKALLEQALDALENVCDTQSNPKRPHLTIHDFGQCRRSLESLRAALAAQPSAPAWHDAPNAPGLWYSTTSDRLWNFRSDAAIKNSGGYVGRWFGPISPDTENTK